MIFEDKRHLAKHVFSDLAWDLAKARVYVVPRRNKWESVTKRSLVSEEIFQQLKLWIANSDEEFNVVLMPIKKERVVQNENEKVLYGDKSVSSVR